MKPQLRARLGAYLYVAASAPPALPLTSDEIATRTGASSEQVRRDLSQNLPRLIGRRGLGYSPPLLASLLRETLAGNVSGAAAILIGAHAARPDEPVPPMLAYGVAAAREIEKALTS